VHRPFGAAATAFIQSSGRFVEIMTGLINAYLVTLEQFFSMLIRWMM
jgi:Na+/phosphate symporter